MLVIEKAGKGTKNFVYIQIFKNKSAKFLLFVKIVCVYQKNVVPLPQNSEV